MDKFGLYFEQYRKENQEDIRKSLYPSNGCIVVNSYDQEYVEDRVWETIQLDNGEVFRVYSVYEEVMWLGQRIALGRLCKNEYDKIISIEIGDMRFLPITKCIGMEFE